MFRWRRKRERAKTKTPPKSGAPTEVKSNVFISRPLNVRDVEVKLIGIDHGLGLPPEDKGTRRAIVRELEKEKGIIAAESDDMAFVPPYYQYRTKLLEGPFSDPITKYVKRQMPQRRLLRRALRKAFISSAVNYVKSIFTSTGKEYKTAPPPAVTEYAKPKMQQFRKAIVELSEKEAIQELKITPAQYRHGVQMVVTGRSLLFASKIIAYAAGSRGKKSMTVVMGRAHLPEVHKFLENPELAARYAGKVKTALLPLKGTEKILKAVGEAQKIFEGQVKANVGR